MAKKNCRRGLLKRRSLQLESKHCASNASTDTDNKAEQQSIADDALASSTQLKVGTTTLKKEVTVNFNQAESAKAHEKCPARFSGALDALQNHASNQTNFYSASSPMDEVKAHNDKLWAEEDAELLTSSDNTHAEQMAVSFRTAGTGRLVMASVASRRKVMQMFSPPIQNELEAANTIQITPLSVSPNNNSRMPVPLSADRHNATSLPSEPSVSSNLAQVDGELLVSSMTHMKTSHGQLKSVHCTEQIIKQPLEVTSARFVSAGKRQPVRPSAEALCRAKKLFGDIFDDMALKNAAATETLVEGRTTPASTINSNSVMLQNPKEERSFANSNTSMENDFKGIVDPEIALPYWDEANNKNLIALSHCKQSESAKSLEESFSSLRPVVVDESLDNAEAEEYSGQALTTHSVDTPLHSRTTALVDEVKMVKDVIDGTPSSVLHSGNSSFDQRSFSIASTPPVIFNEKTLEIDFPNNVEEKRIPEHLCDTDNDYVQMRGNNYKTLQCRIRRHSTDEDFGHPSLIPARSRKSISHFQNRNDTANLSRKTTLQPFRPPKLTLINEESLPDAPSMKAYRKYHNRQLSDITIKAEDPSELIENNGLHSQIAAVKDLPTMEVFDDSIFADDQMTETLDSSKLQILQLDGIRRPQSAHPIWIKEQHELVQTVVVSDRGFFWGADMSYHPLWLLQNPIQRGLYFSYLMPINYQLKPLHGQKTQLSKKRGRKKKEQENRSKKKIMIVNDVTGGNELSDRTPITISSESDLSQNVDQREGVNQSNRMTIRDFHYFEKLVTNTKIYTKLSLQYGTNEIKFMILENYILISFFYALNLIQSIMSPNQSIASHLKNNNHLVNPTMAYPSSMKAFVQSEHTPTQLLKSCATTTEIQKQQHQQRYYYNIVTLLERRLQNQRNSVLKLINDEQISSEIPMQLVVLGYLNSLSVRKILNLYSDFSFECNQEGIPRKHRTIDKFRAMKLKQLFEFLKATESGTMHFIAVSDGITISSLGLLDSVNTNCHHHLDHWTGRLIRTIRLLKLPQHFSKGVQEIPNFFSIQSKSNQSNRLENSTNIQWHNFSIKLIGHIGNVLRGPFCTSKPQLGFLNQLPIPRLKSVILQLSDRYPIPFVSGILIRKLPFLVRCFHLENSTDMIIIKEDASNRTDNSNGCQRRFPSNFLIPFENDINLLHENPIIQNFLFQSSHKLFSPSLNSKKYPNKGNTLKYEPTKDVTTIGSETMTHKSHYNLTPDPVSYDSKVNQTAFKKTTNEIRNEHPESHNKSSLNRLTFVSETAFLVIDSVFLQQLIQKLNKLVESNVQKTARKGSQAMKTNNDEKFELFQELISEFQTSCCLIVIRNISHSDYNQLQLGMPLLISDLLPCQFQTKYHDFKMSCKPKILRGCKTSKLFLGRSLQKSKFWIQLESIFKQSEDHSFLILQIIQQLNILKTPFAFSPRSQTLIQKMSKEMRKLMTKKNTHHNVCEDSLKELFGTDSQMESYRNNKVDHLVDSIKFYVGVFVGWPYNVVGRILKIETSEKWSKFQIKVWLLSFGHVVESIINFNGAIYRPAFCESLARLIKNEKENILICLSHLRSNGTQAIAAKNIHQMETQQIMTPNTTANQPPTTKSNSDNHESNDDVSNVDNRLLFEIVWKFEATYPKMALTRHSEQNAEVKAACSNQFAFYQQLIHRIIGEDDCHISSEDTKRQKKSSFPTPYCLSQLRSEAFNTYEVVTLRFARKDQVNRQEKRTSTKRTMSFPPSNSQFVMPLGLGLEQKRSLTELCSIAKQNLERQQRFVDADTKRLHFGGFVNEEKLLGEDFKALEAQITSLQLESLDRRVMGPQTTSIGLVTTRVYPTPGTSVEGYDEASLWSSLEHKYENLLYNLVNESLEDTLRMTACEAWENEVEQWDKYVEEFEKSLDATWSWHETAKNKTYSLVGTPRGPPQRLQTITPNQRLLINLLNKPPAMKDLECLSEIVRLSCDGVGQENPEFAETCAEVWDIIISVCGAQPKRISIEHPTAAELLEHLIFNSLKCLEDICRRQLLHQLQLTHECQHGDELLDSLSQFCFSSKTQAAYFPSEGDHFWQLLYWSVRCGSIGALTSLKEQLPDHSNLFDSSEYEIFETVAYLLVQKLEKTSRSTTAIEDTVWKEAQSISNGERPPSQTDYSKTLQNLLYMIESRGSLMEFHPKLPLFLSLIYSESPTAALKDFMPNATAEDFLWYNLHLATLRPVEKLPQIITKLQKKLLQAGPNHFGSNPQNPSNLNFVRIMSLALAPTAGIDWLLSSRPDLPIICLEWLIYLKQLGVCGDQDTVIPILLPHLNQFVGTNSIAEAFCDILTSKYTQVVHTSPDLALQLCELLPLPHRIEVTSSLLKVISPNLLRDISLEKKIVGAIEDDGSCKGGLLYRCLMVKSWDSASRDTTKSEAKDAFEKLTATLAEEASSSGNLMSAIRLSYLISQDRSCLMFLIKRLCSSSWLTCYETQQQKTYDELKEIQMFYKIFESRINNNELQDLRQTFNILRLARQAVSVYECSLTNDYDKTWKLLCGQQNDQISLFPHYHLVSQWKESELISHIPQLLQVSLRCLQYFSKRGNQSLLTPQQISEKAEILADVCTELTNIGISIDSDLIRSLRNLQLA